MMRVCLAPLALLLAQPAAAGFYDTLIDGQLTTYVRLVAEDRFTQQELGRFGPDSTQQFAATVDVDEFGIVGTLDPARSFEGAVRIESTQKDWNAVQMDALSITTSASPLFLMKLPPDEGEIVLETPVDIVLRGTLTWNDVEHVIDDAWAATETSVGWTRWGNEKLTLGGFENREIASWTEGDVDYRAGLVLSWSGRVVPEPGPAVLMGLGLMGLAARGARR